MARRNIYTPVHPDGFENQTFNSITAVHKFLVQHKKEIAKKNYGRAQLTCTWKEKDTSRPEGTFNPALIGYREFELEPNGTMSYSRFPMMEY